MTKVENAQWSDTGKNSHAAYMIEVQAISESRSAICWNMLMQLDGAVYNLTVHLLHGQVDLFLYFDKENFSQLLLDIIGAGNLYKSQYHIVFRGHLDGSSNRKKILRRCNLIPAAIRPVKVTFQWDHYFTLGTPPSYQNSLYFPPSTHSFFCVWNICKIFIFLFICPPLSWFLNS